MLLCSYLDERSNSVERQQRVCKCGRDIATVGSMWPKTAHVDVSLRWWLEGKGGWGGKWPVWCFWCWEREEKRGRQHLGHHCKHTLKARQELRDYDFGVHSSNAEVFPTLCLPYTYGIKFEETLFTWNIQMSQKFSFTPVENTFVFHRFYEVSFSPSFSESFAMIWFAFSGDQSGHLRNRFFHTQQTGFLNTLEQ